MIKVLKQFPKQIKRIIFIGFMGSGKTHAAKKLSLELHWRHIDSDAIIEKREGTTIQKIFKDKGESYFRAVESKVIKDLLTKPQTVLSFGGGAVCRKVNRSVIRKKGLVIWLYSTPDVIHARTKTNKKRPLLNTEDPKKRIQELLDERESYYRQCADIVVYNNSGDVMKKLKRIECIKRILQDVKKAK